MHIQRFINVSDNCQAGTKRNPGTNSCTRCEVNTISTGGVSSCTACAAGTVANEDRTECGEYRVCMYVT